MDKDIDPEYSDCNLTDSMGDECPDCNGTGLVASRNDGSDEEMDCPNCDGIGTVLPHEEEPYP